MHIEILIFVLNFLKSFLRQIMKYTIKIYMFICKLAENRDGWRSRVRALSHPRVEVVMNPDIEG